MTPDDLAIIGRYLFGSRWQTALARQLGIGPRRVRYWVSGERPVSETRAIEIASLARERERRRAANYRAMAEMISSGAVRATLLAA